jgi:succinyl-CoA synthetase beta subunit
MKCDQIAKGVIEAAQQVDVTVPIIVRLSGTNAELGQQLLAKFAETNKKVNIIVDNNFDQAADKVVASIA